MILFLALGGIGGVVAYKMLKKKKKKHSSKAATTHHKRALTQYSQQRLIKEKAIDRKLKLSALTAGLALIPSPAMLIATIPLGVYLSLEFFQAGYQELKARKVGVGIIDTLTCGVLLAMGQIFALVFFLVVLFISQKFLLKTKDHSEKKLIHIFAERPDTVWLLYENTEMEVAFEEIQIGDIVVINAGEVIPVDGIIVEGAARIDQHMLTGESIAVEKVAGDTVLTSTMALSGRILVRVEKTGSETVAAKIGDILHNTADFKSTLETRGEKIANQSALPTLALSGLTYALLGPIKAVAVLMAYFGYNMRISAPLSVLQFLQQAADHGILVKDGRALETLVNVDAVIFDKTGTLTENSLQVTQIHCFADYQEEQILQFAATAEQRQSHPIAKAIVAAAQAKGVSFATSEHIRYEIGLGLKMEFAGQVLHIGSQKFMETEAIVLPPELTTIQQASEAKGDSLVYIALADQVIGIIELTPTIRPEAKAIIQQLKQRNLSVYIISGDYEAATQHLAERLGIDNYFAETLPENKSKIIQQLQQQGKTVCFIGDGINDTVALKQANVSISLQGASTAAMDIAQVVLMGKNLKQLPTLFDLADALDRNMKAGLLTTIVPGVVCVFGVYFLHFGIYTAIVLYNIGLAAGVANALSPQLTHEPTHQKALPALKSSA